MTNTELKSKIKEITRISLMVRNYDKRLNTISVWLFPKDRTKENVDKIHSFLVENNFYRVDGFNKPTQNIICVNSGEFNSLKVL